MRSWLLPQNKSASVTLPVGPSKTYSFSILTQGSLRRCRFNSSRSFENFFSLTRSFLRATSHSLGDTTLRFSIPRTVLIFGIIFSFILLFLRSLDVQANCWLVKVRPGLLNLQTGDTFQTSATRDSFGPTDARRM